MTTEVKMVAPVGMQHFPIRIKLLFDFPPPGAPTERRLWFLVDTDRCRLVADLQSDIRQHFRISSGTAVTLFIDGCLAPAAERITLVRDGDCVWVQQVDITDVDEPGFNGAALNRESQSCLDTMTEVEGTITSPEILDRIIDALDQWLQEEPPQKKKSKKKHKRKRTPDTDIMQPPAEKDGIDDTLGVSVSKKKEIKKKPRISGSEGMALNNTHVPRSNARALKNKQYEQCEHNGDAATKRKSEKMNRGSKKALCKRSDGSNSKFKCNKEDGDDDEDDDTSVSKNVKKVRPDVNRKRKRAVPDVPALLKGTVSQEEQNASRSNSRINDGDDGVDDAVKDALPQKSQPLQESLEARIGNDEAVEGVGVLNDANKLGNTARKGTMARKKDSEKLNKPKMSSSSESNSSSSDESPVKKDQTVSARSPKAQTAALLNRGREVVPQGRGIPLALSKLSLPMKGRGQNQGTGALMRPVGCGTAQMGGRGLPSGCNIEGGGLGRAGHGWNIRGGHIAAVPKHTFLNESEDYNSEGSPTVTDAAADVTGTANSQVPKSALVRDYMSLVTLNGTPRAGDNIAFKMLEMGENYSPEVSEYKEGKVLEYNQATCETVILLTKNLAAEGHWKV
uniref:coilin isoform X2 n=1 Tax=Myxine glutinosa TaxID=7769 RepID=UPI00358FF3B1